MSGHGICLRLFQILDLLYASVRSSFSSIAVCETSVTTDFEPSVLASRFSSCIRKWSLADRAALLQHALDLIRDA